MSTAVVVPNSSSLLRHLPRLTARARKLLTVSNFHFAGIAALVVLNLYLVAHLIFVAQSLSSNNADALANVEREGVGHELVDLRRDRRETVARHRYKGRHLARRRRQVLHAAPAV